MQSKRFQWNRVDTENFLKEALKVLAPYIFVIIPVLLQQIPQDWAWSAIVIFLLQRARSALQLFVGGK